MFWSAAHQRFSVAVEGLERLKPGFCSRYDIHSYEDVMFLPETVFTRFSRVMAGIGRCTRLLDRAGIPLQDAQGRELSFWERLAFVQRT